MGQIDAEYIRKSLQPNISVAAEAQKKREAEAAKKAAELAEKRERLMRLKRRHERTGEENSGEEDASADEEFDDAEDAEGIASQLRALDEEMTMLHGGVAFAAAASAAALGNQVDHGEAALTGGTAAGECPVPVKRSGRAGRSLVWKAFDRETNRCKLWCSVKQAVCGSPPDPGSGTSGNIRHLEKEHPDDWLTMKITGAPKTSASMIKDALAAAINKSAHPVSESAKNELDRLVARWVAKCGRPEFITEDVELHELLARILELCQAKLRYELPCTTTVSRHLQILGVEGQAVARDFLVTCLKSGVKPAITGDLWSENGMGLFGIYAHGMPAFKSEKRLIALIACESERHTAVNITQWTEDALKAMGLTVQNLLGPEETPDDFKVPGYSPTAVVSGPDRPQLTKAELECLDPKWARKDFLSVPVDDFIFKKISDNGANMKAAWDENGMWAPCVDHTLELCTLPFTWVAKRNKQSEATIPKGSIGETYAKGRGLVGHLHHSTIAESDFHACQKRVGLAETKIDLDVKTRWRSNFEMGDQLVYNRSAIQEMDKNPAYKDPGEVWGKNKLSFTDWDHLEETSACLLEAADGSQLLEGDLYPTSSLVVPVMYRLMSTSAVAHDSYFRNRDEDEYNDEASNPVMVKHTDLQPKIQRAREAFHERLVERFSEEQPLSVKQFWFISSLLDPRFKKLAFKGDNFIRPAMKRDATKWLTEEFNSKYKNVWHVTGVDASPAQDPAHDSDRMGSTGSAAHVKRRKVSSSSFFKSRTPGENRAAEEADTPVPAPAKNKPHADELAAYLALPQIEWNTDWDATEWWEKNAAKFPNLSVMARQYLGCPATSASVERLFSTVGICFSDKRKSSTAGKLSDLVFAKFNVE